jgi:dsRNA-specific ribonuclease
VLRGRGDDRGRQFESAWGPTKKEAEQKAAGLALFMLGQVECAEEDAAAC